MVKRSFSEVAFLIFVVYKDYKLKGGFMYEFNVDFEHERRSFRQGKRVYSLNLERFWWQELERVTPRPEERRSWVLGWIEDADVLGVNRAALIRARIHQMVVDYGPKTDPGPDPILIRVERIRQLRKKKVPWWGVADTLNNEGLPPLSGSGQWSEEGVRAFFKYNAPPE
jgi:predicted DNA-binding ribbon-helix-helix protein